MMLKNNQKIFANFRNFAFVNGIFCALPAVLSAQSEKQSLPTADQVVKEYVQKVGGKKQLGSIKNSIYEWDYSIKTNQNQQLRGVVKTRMQALAFWRTDFKIITNLNQDAMLTEIVSS